MSESTDNKLIALAEQLWNAEMTRQSIEPLTARISDLSEADAYRIQLVNVERKRAAGDYVTGKKIGLTSLAMQQLLGVDQPDYGHLFASMAVENGSVISQDIVMQPKVEAEIAFILKKELRGPGVTPLDVLLATDFVVGSLEIVDSRIRDWNIHLADTIADNASTGLYVLGSQPRSVNGLDITQLGMALYKNGTLVNTGVGAAAMGNPVLCVAWLANKLAQFDIALHQGEIILSGALSAAVDASSGDLFRARFSGLGDVEVQFV